MRIYALRGASTREEKSYSKTDVRYWKDRLFKRSNDDWHVQIAFAGRQEKFPLSTPNQDTAAAKARDIYLSLRGSGWDATLPKYKPWTVQETQRSTSPTVGQFIDAARGVATARQATLETYIRKFRRLVAGVTGITSDKRKFDYFNGGSKEWQAKLDSVKLSDLTPETVQRWKASFLQKAASNPLKLRHARFTLASIIRCSKALFSEKNILRHLRKAINLPNPLPFEGVEEGKAPSPRYTSKIDIDELVKTAKAQLEAAFPESYKIFLLAFAAGLRREEIDTLTWNQINWKGGTIIVKTNIYGGTKTESSEAEVSVDAALLDHLELDRKNATDEFVIRSPVRPRPSAVTYHHYRCARHFRHLVKWLRSQGVRERNAIHVLRKEFGSQICNSAGIFAASVALRHSNINLTREHYVDSKHRVPLPLGKMLAGKKTDEAPSEKAPTGASATAEPTTPIIGETKMPKHALPASVLGRGD